MKACAAVSSSKLLGLVLSASLSPVGDDLSPRALCCKCTSQLIFTCRYQVRGMLGQGTFGQVVHCQCLTSGASFTAGDSVAVKVIKNQNAFYHQVGSMSHAMLNLAATAQDCHQVQAWNAVHCQLGQAAALGCCSSASFRLAGTPLE